MATKELAMMKNDKKNKENNKVRYCKKCGCELASTTKHKLCDNCRSERATAIRKIGEGVLGVLVAVAAIFGGKDQLARNNKNTGEEEDTLD